MQNQLLKTVLCLLFLGTWGTQVWAQVLVPATGSNTNPCGTNITLCDAGGCTGNYAGNDDGFTVLQNAGSAVINITGPYATESGWDFIEIYAGVGTGGTLLNSYSGTGNLSFTSQPGQTITIYFTSDGIINDAGFNFTVTYTGSCANTVPTTGLTNLPCGTTGVSYTDNGGTGDYLNNSNGAVVFQSGFQAIVNFSGTYDIAAGDTLYVRDNGGVVLAAYSGTGSINYTGQPGQTLILNFISDAAGVAPGFSVNVTTTGLCTNTLTIPFTGSNTVPCGTTNLTLCDHAGCTTNYSNSANGFTVLQNAGNAVITITGSYATESCCDYIRIFNGTGTGGTQLQDFRGTGTINFTSQPGQTITIQFFSDGSVVGAGFSLDINYTGSCENLVPQSGLVTMPCGTTGVTYVDNGGATGDYANNSNGTVVFQSGFQAVINFNGTYDIAAGDTLFVFDNGGTQLAAYSGQGSINYTGQPGQTLVMNFVSNGTGTAPGFSVAVTTTGMCVNQIVMPQTGSVTVPCGSAGGLTICNPGGCATPYLNSSSSTVILENDATGVLSITGPFNVEANWDFIRIFAGAGTGGTLLNTFTGTGTINFTSQPGQTITIEFTSDGIINAPGFTLSIGFTGSCINCPVPSAVITAPTNVCFGSPANLSVATTIGGPFTYNWSPAAGLNDATSATPIDAAVTATTTYMVTATDGLGCTQTASATVNVFNQVNLSTTANGATDFCQGDSVIISSVVTPAAAATSYLWSDGSTTAFNVAMSTGSYQLTVTDNNGCTLSSTPIAVTVNAPTVPTIQASGATTFCFGGSVDLSVVAGTYNGYRWSNGSTAATLNVTQSGVYELVVTDANGCTAVSANAETVTVNNNPFPQATITGSSFLCPGISTDITTAPAASYLWNNGATTQSISVNSPGSYTVTVVDANGCTGFSAAAIVTSGGNPNPSIYLSGCNPITVSTDPFSSYLWSNGATTANIQFTAAGTASVTVTTSAGCQGSASINVPAPGSLSINLDSLVEESAQLGGAIYISPVGGSAPYSIVWSSGQTGASLTGLVAGTYTVIVEDANGCTATADFTISYNIPVLSLEELMTMGIGLKVFPNPTSDQVQAQLTLPIEEEVGYELLDALGRRVDYRAPQALGMQPNFELRLGNQPSGIYLLRLFIGEVQTVQLIQRQ